MEVSAVGGLGGVSSIETSAAKKVKTSAAKKGKRRRKLYKDETN